MSLTLHPFSRASSGAVFTEDLQLGCYLLAGAYPVEGAAGFRAEVVVWDLASQTVTYRDDGLDSGRRWLDAEAALLYAMKQGQEVAARSRSLQA